MPFPIVLVAKLGASLIPGAIISLLGNENPATNTIKRFIQSVVDDFDNSTQEARNQERLEENIQVGFDISGPSDIMGLEVLEPSLAGFDPSAISLITFITGDRKEDLDKLLFAFEYVKQRKEETGEDIKVIIGEQFILIVNPNDNIEDILQHIDEDAIRKIIQLKLQGNRVIGHTFHDIIEQDIKPASILASTEDNATLPFEMPELDEPLPWKPEPLFQTEDDNPFKMFFGDPPEVLEGSPTDGNNEVDGDAMRFFRRAFKVEPNEISEKAKSEEQTPFSTEEKENPEAPAPEVSEPSSDEKVSSINVHDGNILYRDDDKEFCKSFLASAKEVFLIINSDSQPTSDVGIIVTESGRSLFFVNGVCEDVTGYDNNIFCPVNIVRFSRVARKNIEFPEETMRDIIMKGHYRSGKHSPLSLDPRVNYITLNNGIKIDGAVYFFGDDRVILQSL